MWDVSGFSSDPGDGLWPGSSRNALDLPDSGNKQTPQSWAPWGSPSASVTFHPCGDTCSHSLCEMQGSEAVALPHAPPPRPRPFPARPPVPGAAHGHTGTERGEARRGVIALLYSGGRMEERRKD